MGRGVKKTLLQKEIEAITIDEVVMASIANGGAEARRGKLFDDSLDVIVLVVTGPVCDTVAEAIDGLIAACKAGMEQAESPKKGGKNA